ncbi:hypothetical protein FPZ54_19240 [Sphingomonas suaedae]|uniref:ACT domain-containing protein n=1 Tax=Sphingomonas suaedae TaxID=2599297 RepID=A0A518RKG3_9SPHN|nr:hypothetical protein [Sphingomonas suaedae]QDX27934.1 hypothetical protein FPZ54_19240 [Sphingomonas suaedae]
MAGSNDVGTATFVVTAGRCPQLLCRLVGLFAQQDRLVHALRVDTLPRSVRASITVGGIDAHRAEIIGNKMRSIVSVRTVRVRFA